MDVLRFVTHLAPSLPLALFEDLVSLVGEALGVSTSLRSDTDLSGPDASSTDDPLTRGDADVGFVCAPTIAVLEARGVATRLGAVWVPSDPRCDGEPVYFSDVIVRRGRGLRSFADLRGQSFAFNDPASLSGLGAMDAHLRRAGEHPSTYFRRLVRSGSHLASLELVARGAVDAAAIDSNVLRLALARDGRLAAELELVESLGPLDIQPLAIRATVPSELREALVTALVAIHEDARGARLLAEHGFARFVRR